MGKGLIRFLVLYMRVLLLGGLFFCWGAFIFFIQYLTHPLAPPEEGRLPAGLSLCGCLGVLIQLQPSAPASPFVGIWEL